MDSKKRQKKKSRMCIVAATVAIIVCLVAGAGCISTQVLDEWEQEEPARVSIPAGATVDDVVDSLTTRLGGYGGKVARLWKLQKGRPEVAHGSYVARSGMTALQMSRMILNGRQTPVRVTFNNIRTMPQLAERVAGYLEFTPDEFLSAGDSVLPPLGYSKAQYIAAFLPDTYEFYWTASAPTVVERLVKDRDRFWNDDRRAKAQTLGLSPEQVAIVASIAEEETNKPDELGSVARLYLNRLSKHMLLQADPTVKFAVGDFTLKRIGAAQLAVNSPYNTYKHPGLPPGPIRLASQRAIDAVLNAPQHPYLYMCAKEDFSGYHNFATDLPTHQANARSYQAELNRRGIK